MPCSPSVPGTCSGTTPGKPIPGDSQFSSFFGFEIGHPPNLKSDKEPQFCLGLFNTILANSDTNFFFPGHRNPTRIPVYVIFGPFFTPFGLKTEKTNFFGIGQLTMSDLKKIKWETPDLTNTGQTVTKTLNYRGISGNRRKKTHGNSGPTPVARGGAWAKYFFAGRARKTSPLHLGMDRGEGSFSHD